MKDTKVKCDVENCKYNKLKICNLDVLDISSTCKGWDSNEKEK